MANTGMLVSMKPTSISHSGTSASINNNGGVDFSAVTSLSLNGVFTGDYDNYLIVAQYIGSGGGAEVDLRLRTSGTDASGSNYATQYIYASSTSISAGRSTSQTYAWVSSINNENRHGYHLNIYGPYLAQPTAIRGVSGLGVSGAYIQDSACTHSLSTSYDGVTIYPASNNMTGNIHVFGYRE